MRGIVVARGDLLHLPARAVVVTRREALCQEARSLVPDLGPGRTRHHAINVVFRRGGV